MVVEDPTKGTITDANGNWSLAVQPGNTLRFSSIGMKTVDMKVGTSKVMNISMEEAYTTLANAVVIGYGTMKKGEVASAISTVKSEEFLLTPGTNAAELIKGKVPGLIVNSPDGNPVSSTEISLRGLTTLKASASPLVLIDGVPGSLTDVSPEDIDQIDVLKDGSAAAIYGTRGTNGVIIITTKSCQGEMPTTVDFNAYVSTQQLTRPLDFMNASEYRSLAQGHVGYHDDGANTDWLDEITRTPVSQIYNVTLRGGSKQTNYVASFEYRALQGLIKRSDNNMMFPRIDITHRMFNSKVKLHASVGGFRSKFHNGSGNGGPYDTHVWQGIHYNPTTPVYQPDGTYSETTGITDYYNPVSMINESKGTTDATLLRLLSDITYTPIIGLDFKAMASSNVWNQMSGYYETHQHTYEARTPKGGSASRSSSRGQQDLLEITGQWKSHFGENHNYTLLAGYSYLHSDDQNFSANNSGFAVDDYEYNNLGAGTSIQKGTSSGKPVGMSSYRGENALVSFFGRINYDYQGKYMLAASIRREASTKFGENYKWGNFYSVSGAWNLKQEAFLKDSGIISALKLRAGYGETGTEPSSRYMSLNTLTFSSYAFYNGTYIQTLKPSKNANPNLRWERKHELNMGLDFGLLDNRFTGTIDWYNRKTLDLLWDYSVPSPPYIYSSMTANAGSMQNTGIEIGLSYQVINNKNFRWTTSVNYSHNKNTLLALGNEQFMANDYSDQGFAFSTTSHRLQVGEPIGNFWGFKSLDVDDNGHWIIEGEDGNQKPINEQQPSDKQVLGNALPKHYLNWSNSIQWKNFDLGIMMRGAFGFQILNMTAGMYGIPCQLAMGNLLKRAFDPVYGKKVLADDQGYQYVSYFVENGDYWKIDNITLGYTFKFNSNVVKSLRVFGIVRNAATITGYSGNDPEVPISGLTPGMDHYYRYPMTRSYTFGVSFKF